MDFEKQILKMSQEKGSAFIQITLEDDYIIPDVKPDVLKVIHTKGSLTFETPKISNHSVWVNGRMNFTVLYRSDDTQWKVDAASGSIPFQEKLSMDDVDETDEVQLKGSFEDVSASLINSRKIAIRAVVDLEARAENMRWEEVVTGVADDADKESGKNKAELQRNIVQSRGGGGIEFIGQNGGEAASAYEYKSGEKELLNLKFYQKDLLRIHKELTLGQGLPNVLDLVYSDASFTGLHAVAKERVIEVTGETRICVLYRGQGEEEIQFYQAVVPLEGTLESKELTSADICWIDVIPEETEFEIREDYDGEQRVLGVDFAFAVTARAWEERNVPVLEDVYSLEFDLTTKYQPVCCERLLICNQTKARLADQIVLDVNQERMLSICGTDARMVVEHISRKEAGLLVEGMLTVHILYLSNDDFQPVGYTRGFLPVEQLIEIPQGQGKLRYELLPGVEQLEISLMDSGTYEVKATVTLEAMVFEEVVFEKIVDMEQRPLDMEALQRQPGLIGHKIRQQEDLWSIAKEYHTTVKKIMETNHLTEKKVNPGQKIVVVKEILC